MARTKKPKTGSWLVTVEVTRRVLVVCDDCTEEQAEESPFSYAVGDEQHLEQTDWDVLEIEPNE